MILTVNDHYFTIQRSVIGLSSGRTLCSLWGTNCICIYSVNSL